MPNAVKTIDRYVDLDASTRLEQVVSYVCEGGSHVVPPGGDLVHRCVDGGAWNEGGVCSKGLLACVFNASKFCL